MTTQPLHQHQQPRAQRPTSLTAAASQPDHDYLRRWVVLRAHDDRRHPAR